MGGYMITTLDNPFDPRLDFGAWYSWDVGHGYNTSSYLARVAAVADQFPDQIQDAQIEIAIDEIIAMHDGGIYRKLKVEDEVLTQSSEPVPA